MPRLLSSALTWEKNRLDSTNVLSMLVQVDIPGAPVPYRLANYDQDIVFHGLFFQKFRWDVDAMSDSTSLALSRQRFTFVNVTQEFSSLLENYWGPDTPWTATVWFPVDMTQPNETPFFTGDVFEVVQASTDLVNAMVEMQAAGITLTGTIPRRRYTVSGGFSSIPRRF